jgi:thiol-disulfide isomerase/thioredoxin
MTGSAAALSGALILDRCATACRRASDRPRSHRFTGNSPTIARMTEPRIHIACLCAAWCDLCNDYAAVLQGVAAEWAGEGPALQWHWIDIEDEAELVGEVDVETFPTLVIADRSTVRFAGPLTPQPDTLRRLLRATVLDADGAVHWPAVAPEVELFASRLRQRAPDVRGS